MTLGAIKDKENSKFNSKGEVRVFSGGNIFAGVDYDDLQVSYPSASTEQYSAYLLTILQRTVLVTYSDSTKSQLDRFQVTYAI